LKNVDYDDLYNKSKENIHWFINFLKYVWSIIEPLNFLFRTFLAIALILYGNKFHLTLILIQTFRVTALPIITKHWSEIQTTYERVSKIIQEEHKNLADNFKSM